MDEMHIKENVTFKGNRLFGYINHGTRTESCDGLLKLLKLLCLCQLALIPIRRFQSVILL